MENKNFVELADTQITYYNSRFKNSGLHVKYTTSKFWTGIMSSINKTKKISERQKTQLDYLLKNGKSMYEAGVLTTKN